MSTGKHKNLPTAILAAALDVHKHLGPGLAREVYLECFCHELRRNGLSFRKSIQVPLIYRGIKINFAHELELLIENEVIVSIMHVEDVLPIHSEQMRTILKLSEKSTGILLNFNVARMIDGYRKISYVHSNDTNNSL